jgi:hypothetical protein
MQLSFHHSLVVILQPPVSKFWSGFWERRCRVQVIGQDDYEMFHDGPLTREGFGDDDEGDPDERVRITGTDDGEDDDDRGSVSMEGDGEMVIYGGNEDEEYGDDWVDDTPNIEDPNID